MTYLLTTLLSAFLVISKTATAIQIPLESVNQNITLLFSENVNSDRSIEPIPNETKNMIGLIEKKLGTKFDLKRQPWRRALYDAVSGHGIIIGISKTSERERYLDFSETISVDQAWLVTRCDGVFDFKATKDLRGKKIGLVRGTSVSEEFDSQANKLFKVEDDIDSNEARFTKLAQRRMDALIFFKDVANSKTLQKDLNARYAAHLTSRIDTEPYFCVLQKPVAKIALHLAQKKGLNQDTIKRLNAAIVAITRDRGH